MSNEIRVRNSLFIQKDKLDYQSRPTTFSADMGGTAAGPTPGRILATVAGVDVDLSKLTTPGMCRIMNLDSTNYVEYGTWDPETTKFYPLCEILPGEVYIIRLARTIGSEFGTGTGTSGPDTNTLRIKANTAPCEVLVQAFEK